MRWQIVKKKKLDFHRQAFTFSSIKVAKKSIHTLSYIHIKVSPYVCSVCLKDFLGGHDIYLYYTNTYRFFFDIFFLLKLGAQNDYSPRNLFRISFLTTQFIFINFPLLARPNIQSNSNSLGDRLNIQQQIQSSIFIQTNWLTVFCSDIEKFFFSSFRKLGRL